MKRFGLDDEHIQLPEAAEAGTGKSSSIAETGSDPIVWGGEMGALIRALDWSQTALGPFSSWPQSLKTAVRILLASRFAMFVWWGRELVNLYNDSYMPLLGAKHPAALGKPAREVWGEIWDQIGPRSDAVLLRGESTYDEALLLLPERHGYLEETYFTFSYSPLPNDEGKVGGLFCAVSEETQRVIGERRLRLLREIAAAMAESRTPSQVCESAARCLLNGYLDLPFTLIYLLDADGKTLTKAAETGFATAHPAAPAAVSVKDPDEGGWPFRSVIQSGHAVFVEDLSQRFTGLPKGRWRDEPKSAILLSIAQQGQPRPSGVFVAGLNPHCKFDDEYRGFVSVLCNQIGGALANAVAHETERQRAEALAELDRAKTKFFSNVSHEFRTPLSLMLGPLAEVLSESREQLRPAWHQQLVVAHRNALRLLKLVNTLLDFSRIEAGNAEAVYEPTELSTFTQELSNLFRPGMDKAGLVFTIECEPVPEPVYVDRDMWEKIVLNLLSNAFKFTFEGSVSVRLSAGANRVQFSVTDTGVGIPEEEIPRVFERFHRIENSRARTFEGTGIGLALVRELTRLHGGTVDVISSLGKGSTFTVTIPLGKDHLPADRIQEKPRLRSGDVSGETYVEEAQGWLPQGSARREEGAVLSGAPAVAAAPRVTDRQRELILLADDNADMREYVAHLLRDTYRVHTVSDGREAVEATRRLRPDLVLSDVMMPALDGFGVVAAIRNDASLSNTPVILLTARAGEESSVEGLQAGANDYLVKPFTARELLARIGSNLAMSKIRKEQIVASQRLATIVESADDAILGNDLNGMVTNWNRAAEQMFGYRAQEIIGHSIQAIIPLELQADEPRNLEELKRGKRIDHFETLRRAQSGKRIDVSLTLSPIKDESGRIIGISQIARDITQRKKTERMLRVGERLASVGRFAATMAHEINNPLEAATNLVYLEKHKTVSKEVRDWLTTVEEELVRISDLTKQTLGFYRETKSAAPIRIGPILDQLISFLAARIRNKAIRLRKEIRDDPEIYAVADEIRQLMSNLLRNSIDAVPRGGQIRLRVSQTKEWNGNRRSGARLTVADSGSGIPQAIRSELFEPFFTTKKEVGTGLGLWLCKGIVQRHRGSIRVKSSTAPAKSWTVFSVFLPSSEQPKEKVLKEAV